MGLSPKLKGKRFGKLIVLSRSKIKYKFGHALWNVKCECGKKMVLATYRLTSRYAKTKCQRCAAPQHGMISKYPGEYSSWTAMKSRCLGKTCDNFKYYGGRGITICARWLGPGGFVNFVLDMGRRPKDRTLDRKNPEGNYEPGNCKWATDKQQQNNRRCSYTEEELEALREQARDMAVDSIEAEMNALEVV